MALAVPLSRFTSRVGGGSAFFVRHLMCIVDISNYTASVVVSPREAGVLDIFIPEVCSTIYDFHDVSHFGSVRCVIRWLRRVAIIILHHKFYDVAFADFASGSVFESYLFFCHKFSSRLMPNKSPEPTAVIAVSSAIAVHAVVRLWLSFHR